MIKKLAGVLLLASVIFTGTCAVDSEWGDEAGYSLYSDIGAYINNNPIKSCNIEGNTVVCAADLENYGFSVIWDGRNRLVKIERGTKAITPQEKVYKDAKRAGMPAKPYLSTDIKAEMGGKTVQCYNIDGRTMVRFDDLEKFGEVKWDGVQREICLELDGLPMAQKTEIEENPNVVTMYASDGRTITVGNDEVEAYKAVNWHENISEVTATLYAKDGRTLTVFVDEIPLYLKLNWYRSDPNAKMVALTFDDGPSKYTEAILNQLEKYGAKATFFVVGNRVSQYSDILKRESELGMEIGNHSWDHANLTKLSESGIKAQKTQTDNAVSAVTGKNTTLFRPPYGSKSTAVASAYNMPLILWSVDTLDWKTRNAKSTVDAVMNNVKDGDIVLMHDIYESSAKAAVELIPKLIEKGYQLVTVSELGNARGGLKNGTVYTGIRNN